MNIKAFDREWYVRDGSGYGAADPYRADGVRLARLPKDGPFLGVEGVILNAEKASAGIQIPEDVGFGKHTVLIKGRFIAFDPTVAGGIFTHHDEYHHDPGTEVNAEFSYWGDPNNPQTISIHVVKPSIEQRKYPSRGFTHWKIELEQMPKYSAVRIFGWRESDKAWINCGANNWGVKSLEGHTLRIVLFRLAKVNMLKAADRVLNEFAVYGHTFEALPLT